ncbi:hypothetical protein ES703_20013 [subsurface metagenome]
MICAGIDAGSRTIKIVLIDADSKAVIAKGVIDQGVEQNKLALELFEGLLKGNDINKGDVGRIVATGYGRNIVNIAHTTHILLIAAGFLLFAAMSPRDSRPTSRRSATTSRKRPVPAAQRSFIAKSRTFPSLSKRRSLLSCPPISITVIASGTR